MNKLLLTAIVSMGLMLANAQEPVTKIVSGRALTLGDMPVRGLTVASKTLGSKVSTDDNGCFSIACADKDVLIFSGNLFKTEKKKIKAGVNDSVFAVMTFPLSEENIDVAIGYGYIKEKDRTAAVSRLPKGKDYCRYTDMYELLSENFTSLSVIGSCVSIRGNETFNGQQCALLIVDGKEVSTLSNITPCDVKDISVLKDGSTAIYGSRGGNGAVIITLKRFE